MPRNLQPLLYYAISQGTKQMDVRIYRIVL
jgi:hypothetical protein